jgi:hypothetical protein
VDENHDDGEDDLVAVRFGCPVCHERRIDYLEWVDDEVVRCASCGAHYVPGEGLCGRN